MRKDGYYWAKHKYMEDSEVVQVTISVNRNIERVWRNSVSQVCEVSDFEWIDDEPIPVKKMPVKLVNACYYVVRKNMVPFVAKWDENMKVFVGGCQHHYLNDTTIVSGPFSIKQLENLKSC